jgi:hypothetical protein
MRTCCMPRCRLAAIPIVNQKSRWRPVPGAAFHDLLGCPIRCWMPRHLSMEDFSVSVPNHKENVKRLEQDRSDAEKIVKPKCPTRGALGTLGNRGLDPDYAKHAYTSPRFWRKP